MKKRILLLWYFIYVTILLTYFVNPATNKLVLISSLLIIPASLVTLLIALFQLMKHRFKWKGVAAVAVLIISLFQLSQLYSFQVNDEQVGSIRILSFNASFLRIPTVYSEAYFSPERPTRSEMMIDWMIQQNADILCIQEFFNDEKTLHFNHLKAIMERGGYVDYFYINKPQHDNVTSRGVITFSRYPILEKKQLFLGENRYNGAVLTPILIGEDTLAVINVHLKSSAFYIQKNYKSLGGIKKEVGKFFNDGVLKAMQTDQILDSISSMDLPTVVCGDFNSTRFSYVYKMMKGSYANAFEEAGTGFGFTFSGKVKMPLKIDHQFYSDQLKVRSIRIAREMEMSDHYPLVATYDVMD